MLRTGKIKLVPAIGNAFSNGKRDFRLEPTQEGFDEVWAFGHMANAMHFSVTFWARTYSTTSYLHR